MIFKKQRGCLKLVEIYFCTKENNLISPISQLLKLIPKIICHGGNTNEQDFKGKQFILTEGIKTRKSHS